MPKKPSTQFPPPQSTLSMRFTHGETSPGETTPLMLWEDGEIAHEVNPPKKEQQEEIEGYQNALDRRAGDKYYAFNLVGARFSRCVTARTARNVQVRKGGQWVRVSPRRIAEFPPFVDDLSPKAFTEAKDFLVRLCDLQEPPLDPQPLIDLWIACKTPGRRVSPDLKLRWTELGKRLATRLRPKEWKGYSEHSTLGTPWSTLPPSVINALHPTVGGLLEGDAAGQNWPEDPITTAVAVATFGVSRTTLRRYVLDRKIKDYRPPHSARNAKCVFSKKELERYFVALKPKS